MIQNEARMAHTELRINKARLSGGKATHQKETRMANTELRINIARRPGRKDGQWRSINNVQGILINQCF